MGYAWLWIGPDRYATPDGPLIVLRLVAATALSSAAFLLAGIRTKAAVTRRPDPRGRKYRLDMRSIKRHANGAFTGTING